MGYKGNSVQGEIPESGAIFMSNIKTKEECLKRKLFGLPLGMSDFVLHVKEGMTLFLFEFERRLLYGVYRATCDGDIDIEPKAFRSSGKHFPAQVRFTTVLDCNPLAENEFKDVIIDNYYSGKKFHFGLNKKQVGKLMKLFRSNIISKSHRERNTRRYDDKPSDRNPRCRDLRTEIRHRLRFDSSDFRGDEVKEVDDDTYINKHIIEDRQKDKREDLLTRYYTESDEFGDRGKHDILVKHIEVREKHIEDDYMPVFSKPHEIGGGSSGFLMDNENKDIADYNRLHDEYKVRERYYGSLDEHLLTNHVLSPFNQNVFSNCDHIKVNVPDIPLSSTCFDDWSSFIPIANDCQFYPSPEKIHASKSLPYYSHDEESIRYLDDPGSQSSIFPKFISRNLTSDDGPRVHEVDPLDNDKRFYEARENKHKGSQSSIFPKFISRNLSSDDDPRVHEVDPPGNDKRLYEARENKHKFGTTDKRGSVFSRLSSNLRHKERDFETDEKCGLNSSVDKVMKMLEKVASNPIKRTGKSSSVVKQDDDNSMDSKIEDYQFPDVNLEVDADMAYEEDEVEEGDSVFQETRLTDFKRRKKLNKKINAASPECLVGATATSDVGPVETDPLTGTSCKRRKLVRPVFVKKNFIPDGVSAHEENKVSENDRVLTKLVETSNKVDAFINSTDEIITMCATSVENTPDDSNLTKAEIESSEKIDAFNNSANDIITVLENTPDGSNSTKAGIESLEKVDAFNNSTTVLENTPGDSNLAKAGIEKVEALIKPIDLNMLPTSDESSSSKDESSSTKASLESLHMSTAECKRKGNERDGNTEKLF